MSFNEPVKVNDSKVFGFAAALYAFAQRSNWKWIMQSFLHRAVTIKAGSICEAFMLSNKLEAASC